MEAWSGLLNSLNSDEYDNIFGFMCERFNPSEVVTSDQPPPLDDAPSEHDEDLKSREEDDANIIRTLTKLQRLHGNLGVIVPESQPSSNDFSAAFWAHTKQNGITQFWAPRYTMFSRNTTTEKLKVIHMPSINEAISQSLDKGCSAVDLYAGIGYYAFNYVAAGVEKVLCWDQNPWSIEGLRRGALENRWGVDVYHSDRVPQEGAGVRIPKKTRLVAFVENNKKALARITSIRDSIPPIRHVNCGLLPTSQGSYAAAAAALDPRLGGWIHIHTDCMIDEISSKAEEIRSEFQKLIRDLDRNRGLDGEGDRSGRAPRVEYAQMIKPHDCAVDIAVPPLLT